MPVIWEPPQPPARHMHTIPWLYAVELGTIAQCRKCQEYFWLDTWRNRLGRTCRVWRRVRWYNMVQRARIERAQRKEHT